ncbi:MAG: ferredoxin [Thermoleophilaceae bacterium]|jgi:NAD-dependent dihydropyrimidine dehydrogenase PreA subunit|nr:ferredoxin [Thermoleophilaceae bacterium]
MAGVFIDVEIDDSIRGDEELARKLEEACPVDIFAAGEGGVEVVEANLDECILCELCVKTAPPGTLRVRKLYDGTALER